MVHRESLDNGYEKDGKGGYRQINEEGGDSMDYLYENGTIIESKVPFQKGGEVSYSRTYGVLANTGTGGSLNDPSWDIFMSYVTGKGIGIIAKMGLSRLGISNLSDVIRWGDTVVSNQLVNGAGSVGATVTKGLKGGGKGIPFHYHIHKYNWYKPHTWFKNTPIIKPPKVK
ncbi:MAG: hypothetical protein J6581_08370 [Apibacter sp.]|nr:hypothetical protein [Apibacter sp.]